MLETILTIASVMCVIVFAYFGCFLVSLAFVWFIDIKSNLDQLTRSREREQALHDGVIEDE